MTLVAKWGLNSVHNIPNAGKSSRGNFRFRPNVRHKFGLVKLKIGLFIRGVHPVCGAEAFGDRGEDSLAHKDFPDEGP